VRIKQVLTAAILGFACSSALASVAVIGHPSANDLTAKEVQDVYLGRTQGWDLHDYPDSSEVYGECYSKATGRRVHQIKSTWARLVFSGSAQAPRTVTDAESMKQAVLDNPKALGYIPTSEVDASVKVLVQYD